MATSGTVSTTVIDTALVIDHAVRRCTLSPSSLTPEDLDTARNNLYLILSSITNRGVNLWCVERQLVPLYLNQKSYTLKLGTIDVLNANYRTPAALAYTTATSTNSWTMQLSADNPITIVGVMFVAAGTANLLYEISEDGSTWTTVKVGSSTVVTVGMWNWVEIDPTFPRKYFRVTETVAASSNFQNILLAASSYEVPIEPYSRDDYENLSNKSFSARPLNYLYDKMLTPVMTLWPVPNDTNSLLSLKTHRMIQDVGSLSQKIEVPERWFEAIIWMLAKNLSFELKSVPPERISLCMQMADRYLLEAEDGETDSAPIFIAPNIRGYTA